MAYGNIYTCDWDNFKGVRHRLEISKKDYTGSVTAIIGSASVCTRKYFPDEPKPGIKGCQLVVNLVSKNDDFHLSDVYSSEDDTFRGKLIRGADVIFYGYMVQDDCNEIQVDFTHEVQLSFNDGLGLLKDVPLNLSPGAYTPVFTSPVEPVEGVAPHSLIVEDGFATTVEIGDRIEIVGTPEDGFYTIDLVTIVGLVGTITTRENIGTFALQNASITVYRSNLNGRYTHGQLVAMCLKATNLELGTNVYSLLRPIATNGLTVLKWLDDTYQDINVFGDGEKFDTCYAVLETILTRLRATLMQVGGMWNIVRWDELRFGDIAGFEYDVDMVYVQDIILSDALVIGDGTDIETGLTASILRPFKFVQETMNYRQGSFLINGNFNITGPLLRSYTSGTDTVYEYVMKYWDVGHEWTQGGGTMFASTADRFIRVVINAAGEEIERYGVGIGEPGLDYWAIIESLPIELRKDDTLTFSMDYRTNVSQTNKNTYFRINLVTNAPPYTPRAANNRYLDSNGNWNTNTLLLSYVPPSSNTNVWQHFSVESQPVPFDGVLFVKLPQAVNAPGPTGETHYKNLRLTINFSVAGNRNVIGHVHTDTQAPVINNKDDRDVIIDDTPRNSILGTFFLETFSGPLQDRVKTWYKGYGAGSFPLGQRTTIDELTWRSVPRTKLEGLIRYSDVSPLTRINYTPLSSLNFIFGMLETDYKNDVSTGTLWEMFETYESDDIDDNYVFKYLYEKK